MDVRTLRSDVIASGGTEEEFDAWLIEHDSKIAASVLRAAAEAWLWMVPIKRPAVTVWLNHRADHFAAPE